MSHFAATADEGHSLSDALAPVALLLGGVPLLTALVMTAARYVASGSF